MNKNLTLGDLISNFKHSAKRLELLPDYHIEGGEWEDFNNFLNGEVRPPYDELAEWNKSIENWTKQGKTIERIRLLSSPLTDYQKYEILRAYEPGTLCGQKIGVVLKKDFDKVENAAKQKIFGFLTTNMFLKCIMTASTTIAEANLLKAQKKNNCMKS